MRQVLPWRPEQGIRRPATGSRWLKVYQRGSDSSRVRSGLRTTEGLVARDRGCRARGRRCGSRHPRRPRSANRQQARLARTGIGVAQPRFVDDHEQAPARRATPVARAPRSRAPTSVGPRRENTGRAPRATPGAPRPRSDIVERRPPIGSGRPRSSLTPRYAPRPSIEPQHQRRARRPAGGPAADVSTVWPAGRWRSSASLRSGSSSENTSSSSSTGGDPVVRGDHARARPAAAPARASAARPVTHACAPAARRARQSQVVAMRADESSPRGASRPAGRPRAPRPDPIAEPRRLVAGADSVSAADATSVVGVAATGGPAARRARAGLTPAPRRPRPAWRPTRRA